ncbi:hypothetical protein IV73_GL000181 [Weissella kandleri]|uniref:Prophage tail endopeptidase domain-containing protein n=1 Tax=Weissella kandleri TaxID=1616 RepID=A0A0R2JMM3_9LACO|nr:hypothetical protein [Weissella kandleri]KRN75687.1 hypothetical protein IV73_GL000181 [Weissella kandleri]
MSQKEQFLFEVYVDIYTESGLLKYVHKSTANQGGSLDIEFSLPFDNSSDQSTGEVTIWNMSRVSANRIHQGDRVQIRAGYRNDIGIIFDGHIFRTTIPNFEDADQQYILRVVEGNEYRRNKDIKLTFGEGTNARTIINKITQKSGINLNIISMKENHVYKEGYSVDGSPFDALSEVAEDCHSALYYRRGQLTLRYMYDGNNTGTWQLNNGTGMISSPVMERRDDDWLKSEDNDGNGRYQYSVDSILNYRITTGEYVHIKSTFVDVNGTVISGEHSFDGTSPTTSLEIGVQ